MQKNIYAAPIQDEEFPEVARLCEEMVRCVNCDQEVDMSIIESNVQNCKPKLKEIKPIRSKRALKKSRSAGNQRDSFDDSDSDQTWPLTLSLDQQSQEAHQILDTLKIVDPAGRRNIFKCKRHFFLENGDTAVL